MFTFSSIEIDDLIIEHPDRIARKCKQYDVKKDNKVVGKLSTGDKFSFIEFSNQKLRIDKTKKFLKKPVYSISNHMTDEFSGSFEFLDTRDECIVSFAKGSTYFFHKDIVNKKLLNPKTWFLFKHILTDSTDIISFSGKATLNNKVCNRIAEN